MHKWLIFCNFVVYKDSKISKPLEQVRLLVLVAIRSIKSVNASFVSFFIETMTLVLTIKGRIYFLQLARYGKSCESRFRQNFRKVFDWFAFNTGFIQQQDGNTRYHQQLQHTFSDRVSLPRQQAVYGLQHCQLRNVNAIDFHLNLSLAAVNVARAFCKQCGIDYSIGKVKLLLHYAMMIERFISTFGKMTEHTRNKPPVFDDKNKLFKDLLFLGINDAA